MLIELSVKQLLEEVASGSPTPGGGSVSALASALAGALTLMVSRLTASNEKFRAVHQDMRRVQAHTEGYYRTLLQLVD